MVSQIDIFRQLVRDHMDSTVVAVWYPERCDWSGLPRRLVPALEAMRKWRNWQTRRI